MPYYKVRVRLEYSLVFKATSKADAVKQAKGRVQAPLPPPDVVEVLLVEEVAVFASDGTAEVKKG